MICMSLGSKRLEEVQFRTMQAMTNHSRKVLISLFVICLLATGTAAGEDLLTGTQGTGGADNGP